MTLLTEGHESFTSRYSRSRYSGAVRETSAIGDERASNDRRGRVPKLL